MEAYVTAVGSNPSATAKANHSGVFTGGTSCTPFQALTCVIADYVFGPARAPSWRCPPATND